ncbi:MAG: 50S ribosomal protein L18 [Acidobacteria bacterium]|nr:50S ribosomal protein L18 [Acidobacteriota bacterium]
MASNNRAEIRRGVHSRIRKKVNGTQERPRLAVFRSLNHIYAQVIDDVNGKTLAAASTVEKDLKGKSGGTISAAQGVGRAIAERAQAAGISQVVFDRGGYVYHGRVKALLDATREGGLNKNENAADANKPTAAESASDTIASTVGSIVGTVAGAISNLVGGATEKPEKKSGGKRAQTTGDEGEAKTGKVNKENNENE